MPSSLITRPGAATAVLQPALQSIPDQCSSSNPLISVALQCHLCFKQAQPKMYHSPKVENGVKTNFPFLGHFFLDIFFGRTLNCYKSWTVRAIDRIAMLRAGPEYLLSADIHSNKAGIKLPYRLAIPSYVWGFIFIFLNQLLLVMRKRGEPLSTTFKVFTTLML